ncbi:Auxin efflux carrier component 8 [Cardamine amara subsp. amara]|uniref:Auxin efflux carrier component n=1 Tax=Cardamine amara subsp. amara TaxID=228776 RepID=A0ABD1AH46_CARAN
MISWLDIYHVVSATVPLYVLMFLGFLSVKYLKLFSPEQCVGINKFVAKFSIPLLSFQVISQNNPFMMSPKLILSDILQKILAVVVLAAALRFWHPTGGRGGKLGWIITGLSISVFPNTLILGIPILSAIYGDEAVNYLVQIVVLQSLIWYNILLFLFEMNAARAKTSSGASIEHRGNDIEEVSIEQEPEEEEEHEEEVAIVRTRSSGTMKIILKAWRKLMVNPNTYSTPIGLIWAILHFRLGWKLPEMIDKSIHLISDGGLGMSMFSLGLFVASQSSIIACGTKMAIITMLLKFVLGPALMIVSAFSVRLRSTLLRVTILQAALPQGIVPFVFAREYNVHPEIVSTGVVFGMLIALPIVLAYYFVLDL